MVNSLDDVRNNDYLNRFVEIANSYGLEGIYVSYHTSQSLQNEIFFVCGANRERVHAQDLNVEDLTAKRQKLCHLHDPHLAAFKITGNDPLLTHRSIVDYCQTSEFLIQLYNDFGQPLPDTISVGVTDALKMAHFNATNPALDSTTRAAYKKDIKDILESLEKQDPLKSDNRRRQPARTSTFARWFKKNLLPPSNKVSLDQLVMECKDITTVGVHISDADKVGKALNAHPEILYWMADEPVGRKLNCPDNQGYGSKKANDQRFIALSFDREYSAEVTGIINRVEHPEAYQSSPQELMSKYSFVQQISIQAKDYDAYVSAMKSRGIRFCIKDSSTSVDVVNMVIACEIKQNITELLDRLSKAEETKHLYTSIKDRKNSAQEEYLNTQRAKLETTILTRAGSLLNKAGGASDVEFVSISGDLLSDAPANPNMSGGWHNAEEDDIAF